MVTPEFEDLIHLARGPATQTSTTTVSSALADGCATFTGPAVPDAPFRDAGSEARSALAGALAFALARLGEDGDRAARLVSAPRSAGPGSLEAAMSSPSLRSRSPPPLALERR